MFPIIVNYNKVQPHRSLLYFPINCLLIMAPLGFILDKFAYPSGILISFPKSNRYKLIVWFTLCIKLFYVISESAFYIINISNLNESTASLATLAFTITSFIQLLLILKNNGELRELIQRIQQLINCRSSMKYVSLATEKEIRKLFLVFIGFVYLTLVIMNIAPIVNMYLEFRATGDTVRTRYYLVFKLL